MHAARVAYSFGPFRFDPVGFQFLHEGTPVPLAPKGLDLLLLLVTRPGALVSKDEIMREIWNDVVVTDNALTQVVSDLRCALHDDAGLPRYIQTVPRRGYRFIGSVETLTNPETHPATDSAPAARGSMSGRAGVRETSSLDAYRTFLDGRLKLEHMDAAQVPAAVADFERVIALDPRYAPAYVGLAHAMYWRHELSRACNRPDLEPLTAAIANVHHAIDLDPDLAEAHSALALMLMSAGRTTEAVAAGRRAVALEPGNWRNHCRLGVAAWGAERLRAFEHVLGLYPDFAYAYYGTAMVHIARGQLQVAETILRQGVVFQDWSGGRGDRFPGKGLHWLLGLTRLAAGDSDEARAEFERELACGADGIYGAEFIMNAHDGLGFARLIEGDANGARAMFVQALEAFPDHARSLLGLAAACERTGHTADRNAALERAARAITELHTGHRLADAVLATALSHVVNGRQVEAIATLAELIRAAPPGFAGWTIPLEPFLAPLRTEPSFQVVMDRLADRAR